MKKYLRILILSLVTAFVLSACGPTDEDRQKAAAAAAAAEAAKPVPVPATTADKATWQKYLSNVVTRNMQGVKSNNPFMYYVPAGDSQDMVDARDSQINNISDTVARGVLPGNMMAFGGPDSKTTADVIESAFQHSRDGSFKGVVVLFVGGAAEQDRVKAAIAKTGGEFRFVEMK